MLTGSLVICDFVGSDWPVLRAHHLSAIASSLENVTERPATLVQQPFSGYYCRTSGAVVAIATACDASVVEEGNSEDVGYN